MSNKGLVTGIVIGVAITGVICYIIYLQTEKKKLVNDLIRQRAIQDPGGKIISLNSVPEPVRSEFTEIIEHHTLVVPISQSHNESLERVHFIKDIIENRDGYQIFYNKGKLSLREKQLHILYDFAWYKSIYDVNKEVNNGRGPVDFKVSYGLDRTLVEFKMGYNTYLEKNLKNQIKIYQKANHNARKIVVIIITSEKDERRVKDILRRLRLIRNNSIVVIDVRNDNKPSASVA